MWYGNVKGKRTVGNTGCGTIAMYNMFKDINQWKSLPDIISIMEINQMNSDRGGTMVYSIGNMLNYYDVRYLSSSYDNYKKEYKNKEAKFILSIMFGDSGHLIYVIKKKNKVCIYNAYNNTNKPMEYRTLSKYLQETNSYVGSMYMIK